MENSDLMERARLSIFNELLKFHIVGDLEWLVNVVEY